MQAAAARGLGLVAAAVVIGVVLLEVTDDAGAPPPAADAVLGSGETTTTTTGDLGVDTGLTPNSQLTVFVLNAARVEGAAGEIAAKLASIGYQTLPPGNAPSQAETVVYFKPGFESEAQALTPQVSGAALVEPLDDPPRFAGTEEADLVVVIGTNFAGATTSPG